MSQKQRAKPSCSLGISWRHLKNICCVLSCRPLCHHCYPLDQCFWQHKKQSKWRARQLFTEAISYHSSSWFILSFRGPWHRCSCLPRRGSYFSLCMTHGITWRHMDLYFYWCASCARCVHVSQNRSGCFLACWRQRRSLTCAVAPAAPHVLQLGKLHSARLSSRGARDPSAQTTQWIRRPRGDATNVLFKDAEPPLLPVCSQRPPRVLFLHDTWTYDSSTLGLSFNVCQG